MNSTSLSPLTEAMKRLSAVLRGNISVTVPTPDFEATMWY